MISKSCYNRKISFNSHHLLTNQYLPFNFVNPFLIYDFSQFNNLICSFLSLCLRSSTLLKAPTHSLIMPLICTPVSQLNSSKKEWKFGRGNANVQFSKESNKLNSYKHSGLSNKKIEPPDHEQGVVFGTTKTKKQNKLNSLLTSLSSTRSSRG
ncbi:unnamed protein product [Microthlaspi erraticum]|uniref:Uncharacterized protein n=1 Tax=Microthlaspi erraticum TaxID=1685480 RepID=A0A6D2I9H1_9BRAS|nr:unnamed protein product [Microthlaspi erraticum]